MVTAKLDENKNKDTKEQTDGGNIEKVLDVAVPSAGEIIVRVAGGGGRRGEMERAVHWRDWGDEERWVHRKIGKVI